MPFAEVIMNPSAGNARWKKQLPELVAIIESHFAPLHISQTRKAGDARLVTERLIKAYQHKMDDLQLIVIGGDGTLHDVVNGLQRQGHPEVAIGYVPTGTGDDFARANHIPLDPKKAAAALTTAMPRKSGWQTRPSTGLSILLITLVLAWMHKSCIKQTIPITRRH